MKWFAFIAVILCVIFMLATIILGIILGVKLDTKAQNEEVKNNVVIFLIVITFLNQKCF